MLSKKVLQFSSANQFLNLANTGIEALFPAIELSDCIIHVITSNSDSLFFSNNKDESSFQNVLIANKQWPVVLDHASDPNLNLIIINDLSEQKNLLHDNIYHLPPSSIQGKLLSLLYWRFRKQNSDLPEGLSLIYIDSDQKRSELMEARILEMAHLNKLPPAFLDWIENSNKFYNALAGDIQNNFC